MTSIKLVVRLVEPDATRSPIIIKRPPRPIGVPRNPYYEPEPTLAERVFLFLDQRSA